MNNTHSTVAQLRALPPEEKRAFSGVFLLRKRTARTTKAGKEFLVVELGDKTGAFTANIWSDNPAMKTFAALKEGDAVAVEGVCDYYRDALSPAIKNASACDIQSLAASGALEALVKTSPEDPEKLWAEFLEMADSIRDEGLRLVVRETVLACESAFRNAFAAVSMHQAYRHGLLEHSVHVARCAKTLLPLYPSIDADLALAGALLHDVGKIEEYGDGLAAVRTRAGRLHGHLVIGYRMVRAAALRVRKKNPDLIADATLERLEHILLSHHTKAEWGAVVVPSTPEAVFVALVDNLDAKMSMVEEVLRDRAGNAEFSERIAGLETQLLLEKTPIAPLQTELL